jgi:hypothetical protein
LSGYAPIHPIGTDDGTEGRMVLYMLSTNDSPIMQMTLLIYKDGRKESLIGWGVGGNKMPNNPVLLIRDNENTSVCAFLEDIFNIYQSLGTAIRSNEEYTRLLNASVAQG